MDNWTKRTVRLLGNENMEKLQQSCVAVVGIGGVGSFAVEFLVRAGIGQIILLDSDTVESSNRNRQLPALLSTEGKLKTEVMANRLLDINPALKLTLFPYFLTEEDAEDFVERKGKYISPIAYDFVVDAIDSMGPKTALIYQCLQHHVPIISAMGAAGKMNPEFVKQCDISQTCQCALAKSLRRRLGLLGIKKGLPVVFSSEKPLAVFEKAVPESASSCQSESSPVKEKQVPGTISYMPAVFGCHIASYVIQKIIHRNE